MNRRAGRLVHRVSALAGAAGLLFLTVTGLALLHPEWLGRAATGPTVAAADPEVPGRLLRARPFLVEESPDGGATWRDLPLDLAPASPVACRFAPHDSGTVWLLGTTELLVSTDGGRVWEQVDVPPALTHDEPARDLVVTTGGVVVLSERGAWRRAAGAWTTLWENPAGRGDAVRTWLLRLHAGHWGPVWAARLHDLAAVLVLVVTGSGAALFFRGRRRRPA